MPPLDWVFSIVPSGVLTSPVLLPLPPAWNANEPFPTVTSPAPRTSALALATSRVTPPDAPVTGLRGMSFVSTLTNPPIALAPYSNVAGPRTTSMREAAAGFTFTP